MPIGVDIFSGAGGLSLGAEMAGIEIIFAVERDKYAAETYRHNHPNTIMLQDDIHNIRPCEYIEDQNNVFIVFGGPPCQGFSTSNTKTRNKCNPNNVLFEEFVRFVRDLNPEWFLFENVEGIVNFEKGATLKIIKECFVELGYKIADKILVASDYGVPQHRNRFIMVGNRMGIDFQFPEKEGKSVSVNEAIGDLPILENGQFDEYLPYRCEENRACEYARLMRNGSKESPQNYVSKNADYVIERYSYIKQGEKLACYTRESYA